MEAVTNVYKNKFITQKSLKVKLHGGFSSQRDNSDLHIDNEICDESRNYDMPLKYKISKS
jgi:hypothetical protein